MKKLALVLALLCLHFISFSQVSSYSFAYSSGTYTPLVGGQPLVPANSGLVGNGWFCQQYPVALPFVYYYKGQGYSSVYISSNGRIVFDKASDPSNGRSVPNVNPGWSTVSIVGFAAQPQYGYNNLTPPANFAGNIGLGGILDYSNSNPIVYGTIGTAPNRIFVAQWTTALRTAVYFQFINLLYGSTMPTETINFQIRLKETSNVAEIVYNTSTTTVDEPSFYPIIGLVGSNSADVNIITGSSFTSVTAGNTVNKMTFNPSNSVPAGSTYSFTPDAAQVPTACTGTPGTAVTIATANIASGGPVSIGLAKLPLATGLKFQWQRSTTGQNGNWTNISSATDPSYTALPTGTTYYRCQVACGSGTSTPSTALPIGYESSYPSLPSSSYASGGIQANIGIFGITGSCGTILMDSSNHLASYNYTTPNGTSGTAYSLYDLTNKTPVRMEGSSSTATSYTATINNSFISMAYGAWIDFNDNGSFTDVDEYVGNTPSSYGPNTFALSIPKGNFGVHRLRVRAAPTGSTMAPTGNIGAYGQTIDYAVEITPPATITSTNSPFCAPATLTLTATAVAGASYMWSGPASYATTTTSNIENISVTGTAASGVYSLTTTISGSSSCSTGTAAVIVNLKPSLAGAFSNGPLCEGSTLNLIANTPTNVSTYSWIGPVAITGAATASASVPSATPGASGNYSVTVTNGAGTGCLAIYGVAVVVNAKPNISNFSVPSATSLCMGSTSTVTVNSTSLAAGTYFITYDISGANSSTGNLASLTIAGGTGTFVTPTLSGVGSTTVTITSLQNAGSCTSSPSSGNAVTFNVNAFPSPITGTTVMCQGKTTTLSDAGGGAWTSGSTTVATISGTGLVTGVIAGTAAITYTLPTGCPAYTSVTVNATPAAISGAVAVCVGSTAKLTDATPGGTWSTANTTLATVTSGTGDIAGLLAGNPVITYTSAEGCVINGAFVVNPLPQAITGIRAVCEGLTTTLSDANPAGGWMSGNTAVATINPGSGIVSGILAGTAAITYTLPTGCTVMTSVTVNPLPAAITGVMSACTGLSATLSNATPSGTWASNNMSVATIVAGTGVYTGGVAGTAAITYTLPTGCITTGSVTINPLPGAITGVKTICQFGTTTLSNATLSGTWSTLDIATVSIGSLSGAVTGLANGTASITYTLPTGCINTTSVSVNALPTSITGTTSACVGGTAQLSNATPGGSWNSSSILFASAGSATGIVTGNVAGIATITYKLPTGCLSTTLFTINPSPASITGVTQVCVGKTTTLNNTSSPGNWSTSEPWIATVGSSTGDIFGEATGTATITYTLSTGCKAATVVTVNTSPSSILGTTNVCVGLTTGLSNLVSGGTWSTTDRTSILLSPTGNINGLAAGSPVVTYQLSAGCYVTTPVVVNALPSPIIGTMKACEGQTMALTDLTVGGNWTSSNIPVAPVTTGTGLVSAMMAGTAAITYTLGTGCITTATVTVNPAPAPILGVMNVCKGSITPLSDATGGGVWSSSSPALATVSYTGVVTGVVAGAPVITYKLPAGCISTTVVTVDPLPSIITGGKVMCEGATTTLNDITTPGTWSSSDIAIATISTSGTVSGLLAGTSEITYELSTGCQVRTVVTVNPMPAAITGGSDMCMGASVSLGDIVSSGVWSTKNFTIVNVDAITGGVSGKNPGTALISYTLPAGCQVTKTVTVNALPAKYIMTGGGSYCDGITAGLNIGLSNSDADIDYQLYRVPVLAGVLTAGVGGALDFGVFDTAGTYTVHAINRTTGCEANMTGSARIIVNPTPAPFTGDTAVCVASTILLTHSGTGATWSVTDTFATINPTTGALKGRAPGVEVITYTASTGCFTSASVTVNPFPGFISGVDNVCAGSTITMSDAGVGTWSSSRSVVAAIDMTTGVVTGVNRGTALISYKLTATGCVISREVTVNALPEPITGDVNACVGATTYLSDAIAGGSWKTGSNAIATTTSTGTLGVITGVSKGTTTITYTLPTGCLTTGMVNVTAIPVVGAISGATEVCTNSTIFLANPTPGGYWSSKNSRSNVRSDSGYVKGAFAGKDTILYSITNVCGTAIARWEITVLPCDYTKVPVLMNTAAELTVYPNPSDGVFTVKLVSDIDEPMVLVITNIVGQKVKEVTTATNNALSVSLDIPSGVYMLTANTAHGTYVAKITKQ